MLNIPITYLHIMRQIYEHSTHRDNGGCEKKEIPLSRFKIIILIHIADLEKFSKEFLLFPNEKNTKEGKLFFSTSCVPKSSRAKY
jgi:hypothetical protein